MDYIINNKRINVYFGMMFKSTVVLQAFSFMIMIIDEEDDDDDTSI